MSAKPIHHWRAKVAAFSRSRAEDDPDFMEARVNLKAAVLAEHIARTLAAEPHLSPEHLEELSTVLRGGAK